MLKATTTVEKTNEDINNSYGKYHYNQDIVETRT